MIDFSELSLETFQVLRAYGKDIVLYDEHGNRVFEPSDARRFYISGDNILVSILNDGDNSAVKVYLSTDIQISEVLEFVTVLRRIATQFNVLFNVRKYNKKITPRDFATQAAVKEQKEYSMNIMEGLYGTSKSSYLKLENARMIVRHSARVKENMIGGRGRSIQSIFVENAHGERFLFPVNVLSGARAMTQHVNHGGTFADEVGQQIIRMAQDFSDLSKVAGHIGSNQKSLPAQAMRVRESIRSGGHDIRRTFERMCRDEASYIRESARITEAKALTEGSENVAEAVEALQSLLTLGGVAMDESMLETVAKYISVMEDMRPDSAPADDAKDPDDGKPVQPVKPTPPVTPGQSQDSDDKDSDNADDADADQENGSFHEDAEMDDDTVDEDEEMEGDEVAETAAIRAFDAWMESFDPDTFFGEGKSFKRNDDDEEMTAAEKKKKDQEKRDAAKNKKTPVEESVITEDIIDQIDADFEPDPDWVYDNEDAIMSAIHSLVSQCRSNPALIPQLGAKAKKGIQALNLAGFDPMDVVDLDDEIVRAMGLTEGKSFKRNDDDEEMTAAEKKKQDQQKRDAAKNKKIPVTESSESTYEVYGNMGMKSKPFRKSFKTEAARSAWLDKQEGNLDIHGYADPEPASSVEEGKSFKRNKDEDAVGKKKEDKQRRDTQRDKQERTDESNSMDSTALTMALNKAVGAVANAEVRRINENNVVIAYLDGRVINPAMMVTFRSRIVDAVAVVFEQFGLVMGETRTVPSKQSNDLLIVCSFTNGTSPIDEGKSFKRNDDDSEMTATERKKQDQEKRDAAKSKKTPVAESVITESSDDEEAQYMLADQTPDTFGVAAEYVKRRLKGNLTGVSRAILARLLFLFFKNRVEQNDLYPSEHVIHNYVDSIAISQVAELLNITLTEGKSFKRNDDDSEMTAAEKKKQDQEKRDAAKNKKKPVEEGKSFKKNDDDETMSAAEKKKKDQQKRDAAKSKKERTDEASDISFNDAKVQIKQVKGQLAKMSPFDKNYVSMKAHLQKLEDRLSRNGDDDLDEDGIVASSSDELAEESENAGWYVVTQKFAIVAGPFESKQTGWEFCQNHQHKTADSLACRYGTNEDPSVEGGDFMSQIEEASDISFNDAKSEIKSVKAKLNGMNPFDKDYVSTKARLHKLEDRLSRNGDDDLDEAIGGEPMSLDQMESVLRRSGLDQALAKIRSDSNYGGILDTVAEQFGEPVAELIDNFTSADKLHYNQETTTVGEFLSNLPEIVALMNSVSSTDESYVSGDGGYGGDSSDVIESEDESDAWAGEDKESWLGNGNPVKFKAGTGYEEPGIWTPSQVNMERGRCWVGDEDDRGWYVYIDHLVPFHGEDEDDMEEDIVIPRNMTNSLASEVEKKVDPVSGEPDDQSYISRLRTLAGMNKV